MYIVKNYFQKLEEELPELVNSEDLVRLGIYRTLQAAYEARQNGSSPPFIRVYGRGPVYPKRELIDFLKKNSTFDPKSQKSNQSSNANGLKTNSKVPPRA